MCVCVCMYVHGCLIGSCYDTLILVTFKCNNIILF